MRIDSSKRLGVAVGLVVLAIVPYLNALQAGFTFDDKPQIRDNPAVMRGVDPIFVLATPLPPGDIYRPATVFTFAVNEALTPGSTAAFHAVNIVLHALATFLVCGLAWTLFGSARLAVIAAALFAVHPIHTEAVTSLVGRAEMMGALFGLLAILTAAPDDGVPRRWPQTVVPLLAARAISLVAFCLALLSKESTLTVLPLLLLYRVARRDEPIGDGLQRELRSLFWVPYALCIVVFLGLRYYVTTALGPTLPVAPLNNILAFVPWSVRVRSALGVLWDYFGLLNVPFVLGADYSYNQVPVIRGWFDLRLFGGVLLIGAATGIALRHRHPAVRFATAVPFVALALTANLLFAIGTIKAERLLYLPSVGWVLLAAYAMDQLLRLPRYRTATTGVLCAVLALFAARTWMRNWDWRDNMTLYRSIVRGAPYSAKARFNFGVALEEVEGDADAAVREYHRALLVYPLPEAALAIGVVEEHRERVAEAQEWYEKALAMVPAFGAVHVQLCAMQLHHQRFAAAASACRRGLRYHPADPALLKGLGRSLVELGAAAQGLEVLRHSLALDGSDVELRTYLTQWEGDAQPGWRAEVAVQ